MNTPTPSTPASPLWHPFTQMENWDAEEPLSIERGDGVYLFDTEGKRYIDGVASLWCNVHGHRHPMIDRAIRKQLDKVAHTTLLGLTHEPAIALAQKLVAITPEPLTRVFFSDDGSTAVEAALKIALQYQKQRKEPREERTKFLALGNSYHGDTLGAVSVGGMELFHETFRPLLFDTVRVPQPHCYRCPYELKRASCETACATDAAETIRKQADTLAAVIIEPIVMGAAGIVVAPEGYLRAVREACTEADVLLIADEVAVGFGRTGTLFACEKEAVAPDLLLLAKGITGGYLPLAATLATEEVYAAFLGDASKTFFHGHTYSGSPLACAAALANLDLFESDRVIENIQPVIHAFTEGLARFGDLAHVGDIRQQGLMAGIELVANTETGEPYDPADRIGHKVIGRARQKGVILRPLGDVIVLMPPLSITFDQLADLLAATEESIREITKEEGS